MVWVGDYLIRTWDWDHTTTMDELAAGQTHGISLMKMAATVKGVLHGYPNHLPLNLVLGNPYIVVVEVPQKCWTQMLPG